MRFGHPVREFSGVILLDLPRYLRALRFGATRLNVPPEAGWTLLRNRAERLIRNPSGPGVQCDWRWTSDLHACRVVPKLGLNVMRAAFEQWPVRMFERVAPVDEPQISFVIPHRGAERLPLLLATLESIFAQKGVAVECIVVEQGPVAECKSLPDHVRLLHCCHPSDIAGWYKSWAYNCGVAATRAPIVVCHDGDVLVPENYGSELLRIFEDPRCQVAYAQRFLFYLTREHSEQSLSKGEFVPSISPEKIVQNWKGGTLAIRRGAYFELGGFDERFEGWSGEDIEFHDRCLALEGWHYGYLPFVHLWHLPQSAKTSVQRERNIAFTACVMQTPREERIRLLTERQPWVRDPSRLHPAPTAGKWPELSQRAFKQESSYSR
jgi:hypothetical protein